MSIELSPEKRFMHAITRNSLAERAPVDELLLQVGASQLSVRQRGCFITKLALQSQFSGNLVNVLYAGEDLALPKLPASHAMSPVGRYSGLGGQHGFARWADYHLFQLDNTQDGVAEVSLQAKRIDAGPGLSKYLKLTHSKLQSTTSLYNDSNKEVCTSLGEHYYFNLNDDLAKVRVNGVSLPDLLQDAAALETINAGEAMYWPDYDGQARLSLADDHTIVLAAYYDEWGVDCSQQEKLGMLVWRRPGHNYICFEPTIGFNAGTNNSEFSNTGLTIAPSSHARLATSIEVL